MLPASWPEAAVVVVDWHVFLFTIGLAFVVGIVVIIQPCWQLSREAESRTSGLLGGRRSTASQSQMNWRWSLNVLQIALVTMLLSGSGLFIRTLMNLWKVDSGYGRDRLLCLSVSRPDVTLGQGLEGARQYYASALEALRHIRGVESVSGVDYLPVRSTSEQISDVTSPDSPTGRAAIEASPRIVAPGYFRTMRIGVIAGGDFDRLSYRGTDENNAIVSRTLAASLWGNPTKAVGHLVIVDHAQPLRVIGVVGDTRFFGPRSEPEPEIYRVLGGEIPRAFTFVVRTYSDPMSIALAAQAELRRISAVQPIDDVATMEQYLGRSLQTPRSLTILLNLLAVLGLTVAIIGTYGLVWYSIRRSWKTFAIHLAIGGDPYRLMMRSVGKTILMMAAGVTLGLVLAMMAGRLVESQLFGVRSSDPLVFVISAVTLLSLAVATAILASRQILTIDPAAILREAEE